MPCRRHCRTIVRTRHHLARAATTSPPPNAIGESPRQPSGFGEAPSAASTTWRWTSFRSCVGAPTARAATTSAASLPARTAPSMLPRYFWLVKQPHNVRFGIGVFCDGRYLLRPGWPRRPTEARERPRLALRGFFHVVGE